MAEAKKGYEVKIGILTLAAILALFLGFNFFKGNKLFSSEKEYSALFDNVEGISPSSKIMMNGYKVGKVSAVDLMPDQKFKVSFVIDDDFKLMEGSSVQSVGSDLLSGAKNLVLNPSDSKVEAKEGSTIPGSVKVGLMDGLSKNAPSVMEKLNSVAGNADTLVNNLQGVVTDRTAKHIDQILVSLSLAMKQLEILTHTLSLQSNNIAALVGNANGTVSNLNKVTDGLANNGKINNILSNAENATGQLSQAKIQETINNLEATTQKLDGLINKLNQSNGSLGLLINDPQLYNKLNTAVGELTNVMTDLKAHPSRYINVSVFPAKQK